MGKETGIVIEVRRGGRVMFTEFLGRVRPKEFKRILEEIEEIAYKLSMQEL